MEVKQRRKSIEPSPIVNPFSNRPCAAKGKICPSEISLNGGMVDVLELSDSSLSYSHHTNENDKEVCLSAPASVYYAVKVLSLLLVALAMGLLYHLAYFQSTTNRQMSSFNEAVADSFLTDELVKKLAQDNQLQEQEILLLRQQVEEQRLQQQHQQQQEGGTQESHEVHVIARYRWSSGTFERIGPLQNLRGAKGMVDEEQEQRQVQHEQEHGKTFLKIETSADIKHVHHGEQNPQPQRVEEHPSPRSRNLKQDKTFLDLSLSESYMPPEYPEIMNAIDDIVEEEEEDEEEQLDEQANDAVVGMQLQQDEIQSAHEPQPQLEGHQQEQRNPREPHEIRHGKTFLELAL